MRNINFCEPQLDPTPTIKREIIRWINETRFAYFKEAISCQIIGQPNLELVLCNVYNYLQNIAYEKPINHNIILTAPSGCGKTETYRAICKYFKKAIPNMPVYIVDASNITPAGMKGANSNELMRPYHLLEIQDMECIGICFMDEFDKIIMPTFDSHGTNVHYEVQSNLLQIVEGGVSKDERSGISVNTENMMFIACGAFDYFRKERNITEKHMGFGQDLESKEKETDVFDKITREDMLNAGASNELVGRFPIVLNYGRLTKTAVNLIIDKTVEKVACNFNSKIKISKKFREYLQEQADNKFGCRLFDSIIREQILKEYANICDEFFENEGMCPEFTIKDIDKVSTKWIHDDSYWIREQEKQKDEQLAFEDMDFVMLLNQF